MKLILLLTALFLSGANAYAISETDNFGGNFRAKIVPFYLAGTDGFMDGREGVKIHYHYMLNPRARGVIVVSNGYTEFVEKNAELAFDFYQAGYSVFLFDQRGQGASGRMIENSNLAHVDWFYNFVFDLRSFVEEVVKPNSGKLPLYLYAHSMGAGIAGRYVQVYSKDFQAAVLSAPLLQPILGNWNLTVAKTLLRGLIVFGQGGKLALTRKMEDPYSATFDENARTHSLARYLVTRGSFNQNPRQITQAPTNGWVLRMLNGGQDTMAYAPYSAVPTLLLQAGQDSYVMNPPQNEFCRKAPRCELLNFPNSRHEIFQEVDAIRDPAMKATLDFFASH